MTKEKLLGVAMTTALASSFAWLLQGTSLFILGYSQYNQKVIEQYPPTLLAQMVFIDKILVYPGVHWLIFITFSAVPAVVIMRDSEKSHIAHICLGMTMLVVSLSLGWLGTILGAIMLPYY